MLVLSRRRDEKIVLPSLGVTVHLLGCTGNSAKIGIEAPPGVKILRHELAERIGPLSDSAAHALSNALNRVSLTLHLAQRQLQAGQTEEAEASVARAIELFDQLDKEKARSTPADNPATRRFRTLVVEDDVNERELLKGLLTLQGCDCATAADGKDALDYLSAHERPDVVLLDMWMPRCDGPNTLEQIRRDPRLEGVKVYSISGTAPRDMGIATGPEGIDGWFPKPLNPRKLWDAIRTELTAPATN